MGAQRSGETKTRRPRRAGRVDPSRMPGGGIVLGICVTTAILLCATGCTFSLPTRDRAVEILTYNVQNLFDDHVDGNEYEEFDPNRSGWSTAEYYRRLQDLSRVIRDSTQGGPDVVALQEIEHGGVLDDLLDRFLGGLGYTQSCAAEPGTSPIVVGVLSRYPILEARSHSVRIDDRIAVRPMLEVLLDVHGTPLALVVCHWKSKSGGARETEPYRIAAASALRTVLAERSEEDPSLDMVVVGDLNERPGEQRLVRGEYRTALTVRDAMASGAGGATADAVPGVVVDRLPDGPVDQPNAGVLYSPWFAADAPGSYCYRGMWERIDHVLLSDACFDGWGLEYSGFSPVAPEYAVSAEGFPIGYSARTGRGFSDHLPLLVSFERRE